jgi:hypothetical protein
VGINVDNVTAWFVDHVPDVAPPLSFELVAGGRSNLTFKVTDTAGHAWALRRPPTGHVLPTAHDMRREYRVMSALQGTPVPVPRTLHLCEDADVLGQPFYVMEAVDGYVCRESLPAGYADEPAQRRAMVDAMVAWNTDWCVVYIDIAGTGLLVGEAERQGKIVVSTELGGGGHVTAAIHRLARSGLDNVLRRFGVLAGEPRPRDAEPRILMATELDDYLLAPESGLFETLVDLGEHVELDQPVGRIHFLERPDREPETIVARSAGTVCVVRAIATTQQGDNVVVIGRDVSREELL